LEGGGGAAETAPAPTPMPASGEVPSITLNLRRISLMDALKIITEVANLKYRIQENVVMIRPIGAVEPGMMTELYPVQPTLIDMVVRRGDEEQDRRGSGEFIEMGGRGAAAADISRADVKQFFADMGVPFPPGSSVSYNEQISQLIVRNTRENLEIFETILSQLNVIPNQVEIEAKFVEISQNDLEELGFEWILTDDWEIAMEEGTGPIAARERLIVDQESNGFTKGNRFFQRGAAGTIVPNARTGGANALPMVGDILSISSVLTNPEVNMVLHALDRAGGSDVLSAPRVTTRSGINAQIQVVREIIYPTEFDVTEPTVQSQGNLVTPPTVTPGAFETRETGVILNVTPTVGPDGYTIDLTLVPEVSELVGWIQYGSSIGVQGQTFTYNIPQPVFSSRNVTTSIVIWDGQTVVMGGLMREDLRTVRDKVPIIGDIPLLGRFFRNEGENSQKINLIIFVTARLVDPAGKRIRRVTGSPMTAATESEG
ncbi:MAG: hypothetical protein GF393_08085, partial [Armatimonadia bacterium]|nr:hypothetical protein [Armatimonadia bacterium]